MAADFGRRFNELRQEAEALESSKVMEHGTRIPRFRVDENALLSWQVKARHLISSVCGRDSEHFDLFVTSGRRSGPDTNFTVFKRQLAVFMAAKDDYEGGYLNKMRNLIQAEVFENEIEQAEELLAAGYLTASAVVAGVVLETSLRQMCADNGLAPAKLDAMNAALAKVGAYNKLVQKQITAWASIRNSAAHGETGAFVRADVEAMVRDVQRFVAERLI